MKINCLHDLSLVMNNNRSNRYEPLYNNAELLEVRFTFYWLQAHRNAYSRYVNLRKWPVAKVVRIVKGMVRLDMVTISIILWLKEATLHLHQIVTLCKVKEYLFKQQVTTMTHCWGPFNDYVDTICPFLTTTYLYVDIFTPERGQT